MACEESLSTCTIALAAALGASIAALVAIAKAHNAQKIANGGDNNGN